MSRPSLITKLLAIVAFSLFLSCCKDGQGSGKQEGTIEFDTKGVDEKHPFYGLAPSEATLKFKDEKFIMEMSTMGMFNTTIIGDLKAKTMAQTVKFMNIKQACVENENEIKSDNKDYELKIEETKDTKKIAGYNCRKLKVTMVRDPNITFDAWYTKDLGAENCNMLNPYHEVKGMLMDYRVKKMGLEMHFVAKSVKQNEIPESSFEIPASLKIISKDEMKKFFDDLQ